jgi:hypothetical protein
MLQGPVYILEIAQKLCPAIPMCEVKYIGNSITA